MRSRRSASNASAADSTMAGSTTCVSSHARYRSARLPSPRQCGIELLVRLREALLWHGLRPHAVAALDFVRPRDRLAREPPGRRLAAASCARRKTLRCSSSNAERLGELGSLGGERRRVRRLLGIHLLLELGRPVVGVDEAVDVTAKPQAEDEVPLEDVHEPILCVYRRSHDGRGSPGQPAPVAAAPARAADAASRASRGGSRARRPRRGAAPRRAVRVHGRAAPEHRSTARRMGTYTR